MDPQNPPMLRSESTDEAERRLNSVSPKRSLSRFFGTVSGNSRETSPRLVGPSSSLEFDSTGVLARTLDSSSPKNRTRRWVCVTADSPSSSPTASPDRRFTNASPNRSPTTPARQEEGKKEERREMVAILDQELKESGYSFKPLKFNQSEKALLRDNMTSVRRRDIQPKWLKILSERVEVGTYLTTSLRLVHQSHAYKIKRISFDRHVLRNGLLYFVDALDRDTNESFHIWLYVRLVRLQNGLNAQIEEIDTSKLPTKKKKKKEEDPLVLDVHDWNCKKCKHRKPCDHKFKAVEVISDYSVALHIKFPMILEGTVFLYCVTLNSPGQAALSSKLIIEDDDF